MTEIKATAMATEVAATLGVTRSAAFDTILATALDLKITGTRFTEKQAEAIKGVIANDAKNGATLTLTRQMIGA
jgi:hypothetical protein